LFDLLRELVVREIKLQYERSILGVFWAVLNPLAQLVVFVIVFQYVLRLTIPSYPLFVFTGVLAWNWTRDGLTRAANSITSNRELVRQPGFPVGLLPAVALTAALVDLLVGLPLAFALLLLSGGKPSFALLALPVVIAVQFLLLQGIAYLVAAAQVTFRDTSHLLGVALMLLFYMTPVFYDVGHLPASYQSLYALNPMTHLVAAYRAILMLGTLPDVRAVVVVGFVGAVLWWFGRATFTRASTRFAEEL